MMDSRIATLTVMLTLACAATNDDTADTTATTMGTDTATSGGSSTGSSTESSTESSTGSSTGATTGACGELPPCDLCPSEQLCGVACATEGQTCSNEIGDGMSCDAGTWSCIVHPPLGTDCNAVCETADSCSEIGCTSGLTLALVAAMDAFAPGTYAIATVADGRADACELTISNDAMDCALPPCVTDSTCNAIYLLNEMPMRIEMTFGVVESLDVTVELDTVEIAQQSFMPAYDIVAPNGPGCGPACAVAEAELALP